MLSVTEITDLTTVEYLRWFASPVILDLSTIRNKLTEYVTNGVPCSPIKQCGGHAIRLLDNNVTYMVMEFCAGKFLSSYCFNVKKVISWL